MRYGAFALGIFAGVLELTGAVLGLGIAGVGFVFGGGGLLSASTGVGMAMLLAVATIFCAVAIMFLRDPRPVGILIAVAAVGAVLAGGPFAAAGGLIGLGAAALTFRLDRNASFA
jgi:hypothetical protein